jgi:hypothetical protein
MRNLIQELTALVESEQYKFIILTFLTGTSSPMKEFTVIARTDREAKILAKKKLADRGITNIRSLHIQGSELVSNKQ